MCILRTGDKTRKIGEEARRRRVLMQAHASSFMIFWIAKDVPTPRSCPQSPRARLEPPAWLPSPLPRASVDTPRQAGGGTTEIMIQTNYCTT